MTLCCQIARSKPRCKRAQVSASPKITRYHRPPGSLSKVLQVLVRVKDFGNLFPRVKLFLTSLDLVLRPERQSLPIIGRRHPAQSSAGSQASETGLLSFASGLQTTLGTPYIHSTNCKLQCRVSNFSIVILVDFNFHQLAHSLSSTSRLSCYTVQNGKEDQNHYPAPFIFLLKFETVTYVQSSLTKPRSTRQREDIKKQLLVYKVPSSLLVWCQPRDTISITLPMCPISCDLRGMEGISCNCTTEYEYSVLDGNCASAIRTPYVLFIKIQTTPQT